MKKFLAAIGAFFTFVTLFAQSPKKVEDLAGFRQIYENRVTQIDQKYLELLTKAPAVYANALTVMEQAFTKKGDLDGVIAIKGEVARFIATKVISDEAIVTSPAELKALQQQFQKTPETLKNEKQSELAKLNKAYLSRLEQLKINLTRVGNVDEALRVKAEVDKVQTKGNPDIPAAQGQRTESQTEADAADPPKEQISVPPGDSGVLNEKQAGLVLIPAGVFQMGDSFAEGGGPVSRVTISEFYIGKMEVTKAEWDEVRDWGQSRDYPDLAPGEAKDKNHPIQLITWWDAAKYCNARSEKEGLTPVYSVEGAVMRAGRLFPIVNWTANGYRLPTEAEWEKAARGGLKGKRFPWGNTISYSQANYNSDVDVGYDVSPAGGLHPTYEVGERPHTSPVGSFAPNAYGLHDMAGNAWEWCWDWAGVTTVQTTKDPRGPRKGSARVMKGGSWFANAISNRVDTRFSLDPGNLDYRWGAGVRLVRSTIR